MDLHARLLQHCKSIINAASNLLRINIKSVCMVSNLTCSCYVIILFWHCQYSIVLFNMAFISISGRQPRQSRISVSLIVNEPNRRIAVFLFPKIVNVIFINLGGIDTKYAGRPNSDLISLMSCVVDISSASRTKNILPIAFGCVAAEIAAEARLLTPIILRSFLTGEPNGNGNGVSQRRIKD